KDPVTNRFGPRFSPISNAKGGPGVRAASNDAAGRLLTSTELTAATAAVPHRSRWDRSAAGPDQSRPSGPSATATPNKPARAGTPTTAATFVTSILPVTSRSTQSHYQHRGQDHGREPEPDHRPLRWRQVSRAHPQLAVLEGGDNRGGH